jgi:polysaccharide export outer membrane protein
MKLSSVIIVITSMFLFASCSYQNIFSTERVDSLDELLRADTIYQHIIGVDDKLSVSVWNHENLSIGSVFGIYNSNEVYGRWVLLDVNGDAMLPKIGKVNLVGLTREEAADKLSGLYGEMLVNPIIVVRIQNKAISILGEVRTPGKYILEKETNTLTELIASAQGFEFYADKKNILLLRKNKTYKIDLTVLENNNYRIIVKNGDVVSVPSRGGKMVDKRAPTLIAFASAITAIAVLISLIP